ncbi:hypothetical protein AHAS_Ahas13G0498200 [Arachis hypogaea]
MVRVVSDGPTWVGFRVFKIGPGLWLFLVIFQNASAAAALECRENYRCDLLLQWRGYGLSFPGYLVSVDSYMNLQLANTEEYIEGQFTGNLGEILIRCNNVLYLRGVPEDEEIDAAAED